MAESGDEREADDNDADGRDNRKRIDDDVRNSPSGFVGRRMLPATPKTDGARLPTTDIVARLVQRRPVNSDGGDDDQDSSAFVITYDAPPSRRDLHPQRSSDVGDGSDNTANSNWTAEMRSLAESKLQIRRRRPETQSKESAAPTGTMNATKKTAPADVELSGAKTTRNVIVSSGKQLPSTTDHFVPISNGVTTKLSAAKSSRPTADVGRSRAKASGGPNAVGSQSARTTPQQAASPTKDVRSRSKSNARDDRTTTTTTSARSARDGVSDVTRRTGVTGDVTRRHRTRDDVTTDTTSARPPGGRSTATRQSAPPASQASTKLRSTSQKRPGETGGGVARRTSQDATRSQYARSPERGRTSTRQSDVVSKTTTDARTSVTGSYSIYRSSSATVLPTPRRTASRSPQRPYVPASTPEQERLQNAREAFKKRMTYDPSKSAAMGRAAAALGRRSGDGSTERLSPLSGGSRRSSHGSVSGISDDDATFGRSAAAVAKYSSSVACDINALSQRAGSGRTLSAADDDDNDLSKNMVRCSALLVLYCL